MAFDIVSVLASKGGAGKTACSNALAFAAGRGEFDYYDHVIYLLTDSREQLDDEYRPYTIEAARSNDDIDLHVGKARASNINGLLVIDGAGGNPDADQRICNLSDLVLIPMMPDTQSCDEAIIYASKMPKGKAFILPNRWPTNDKAALVDEHYLAKAIKHAGADRVLPPLVEVHSVNDFVRPDFHYANVSPRALKFSRSLLGAVITLLQRQKESA